METPAKRKKDPAKSEPQNKKNELKEKSGASNDLTDNASERKLVRFTTCCFLGYGFAVACNIPPKPQLRLF